MFIKKIRQKRLYVLVTFFIGMLVIIGTNANNHIVSMDFLHNWSAVAGSSGVFGYLPVIRVDNQVAWCLQANKAIHTGNNSLVNFADIGINPQQQQTLSLIANFGYYSQPTDDNYALVQNLVWDYLGYDDYYASNQYPTRESQQSWKDQVMAKVNAYQRGVSFHNQEYDITIGQSIRLDDTNGVLAGMEIISTDGLEVSINGNTLVVTANLDSKDTAVITLKKPVSNEGINFVVRNGDSQAVSVLRTQEANHYSLTVNVDKYIDVNLSKVDSKLGTFIPQGDATLIGAEYSLFNSQNELLQTKVIDESGKVRFERLSMHEIYYIKETKAPEGYILSEEILSINPTELYKEGQVDSHLQWHVTVKEEVMKQAFSIIKVSTDGESGEIATLSGAEFTVSATRL